MRSTKSGAVRLELSPEDPIYIAAVTLSGGGKQSGCDGGLGEAARAPGSASPPPLNDGGNRPDCTTVQHLLLAQRAWVGEDCRSTGAYPLLFLKRYTREGGIR